MSVTVKQIGFIVHGHPARRKRFERALSEVSPGLFHTRYRIVYTRPGMVADDARNLADDGCTHIIGVGGDGTLSDVINGIMESDSYSKVIAGLLPHGTANDWSKTWRSAPSVTELLKWIDEDRSSLCDLGCIEFNNGLKQYFINIADLGIGAEVVSRVNRRSKWLGANITFSLSILETLLQYRNIEITCQSDDMEWTGKAKAVIAANGRYFGSGLCIAPDASPSDGLLDLIIVGDVSLWDYIKYLPALKKAELIDDPRVSYQKIKSIRINAPDYAGVEADGELVGSGSIHIRILPKRIRLLDPFE